MDWNDKNPIRKTLDALQKESPIDCLISWIHDKGLSCLTAFETQLMEGARSIRVHGSAAGDPYKGIASDPLPPIHIMRQNVVLGWVKQGGGKRWLTDQEISFGVINAFDTPSESAFIIGEIK